MIFINNTKSKINKNKVYDKKKQDKYLVYNSQHSFAKFKDINEFNELLRDSMYKRLNDFKKRFNRLKIVNPQTNNNKVLKQKVLDDVRDLFNELCYIYKDKYKEEKYGLNARGKKKKKKKKKINCKKLTPTDDYQYESEEKEQQTSKKESPRKPDEKRTTLKTNII